MRLCPRCGAVRENATPIIAPITAESAKSISPSSNFFKVASGIGSVERVSEPGLEIDGEQKTEVIPFDLVRLQTPSQQHEAFVPTQNLVFLSPDETERRFPLFTAGQKTLIAIGMGLLALMLVIAYLLWRQQRLAQLNPAGVGAATPIVPIASPTLAPSPTPTPSEGVDDANITESVKSTLMAYNPLGFNRYKYEVKEGMVTINGEAEHQPEKDGVENVVRLIPGVRSVVNNLKIKPQQAALDSTLSAPPVKLNTAEAKVLDDAMRRQMQLAEQPTSKESSPPREVRDQAAAKQREEEAAIKKVAEDRLRREAEEFERRQEESRRIEADRRARAEQARVEANALRSGTIAWSALVEGIDEIIITGSSASVRHVSGTPPREVKASFSAPVPRSPANVKLISTNGRGAISIVQEPSAANGYTTIVRVDDSEKSGDKLYQFTLRWTVQ